MPRPSEVEQQMDTFFQDLQEMWGPLESFISMSHNTDPVIKSPTHQEALRIWIEAGLFNHESRPSVEPRLLQWATENHLLSIRTDGVPCIAWRYGNTSYSSTWSAFLKWVFSTCEELRSPKK